MFQGRGTSFLRLGLAPSLPRRDGGARGRNTNAERRILQDFTNYNEPIAHSQGANWTPLADSLTKRPSPTSQSEYNLAKNSDPSSSVEYSLAKDPSPSSVDYSLAKNPAASSRIDDVDGGTYFDRLRLDRSKDSREGEYAKFGEHGQKVEGPMSEDMKPLRMGEESNGKESTGPRAPSYLIIQPDVALSEQTTKQEKAILGVSRPLIKAQDCRGAAVENHGPEKTSSQYFILEPDETGKQDEAPEVSTRM